MCEILFRGKLKCDGEWVEGYYLKKEENKHYMVDKQEPFYSTPYFYEVIPETVGQYTGLTDKNGKKIFEGDIIRELDGSMDDIPRLVRWDEVYMEFKCPLTRNHWAYGNNDCSFWLMQSENIEIIGNIHDNPELLGGESDD
jgi:uncharacterized phage protein (TIGR01671 family)